MATCEAGAAHPTELLQTRLCESLHFRATASDDASGPATFDFELPVELEAREPPEARGLARDGVRLMVSHRSRDDVEHTVFRQIGAHLDPGDVLVINTSATLNAALNGSLDGAAVELHLSTQLSAGRWSVELRRRSPNGTQPWSDAAAGDRVLLPEGASARLVAPLRPEAGPGVRLWIADLALPGGLASYLPRHGFPIRYDYVAAPWPLEYYQTTYANTPGSAEMPSAGRAFTPELITELVASGVQVAPVVLHTGVASLEDHEPPYAERYQVPAPTAGLVNAARRQGRRIIAVGTTAVRALESAADDRGVVQARAGWTELVIYPETRLRAVNGLLTGLHEPRATHLAMLLALVGPDHVCATYAEALEQGYLWHEFGDLHLLL